MSVARLRRRRGPVAPIVRGQPVRTTAGVIIGLDLAGVILSRRPQSSLPFISDIKVHLIWARYHFDSAARPQLGQQGRGIGRDGSGNETLSVSGSGRRGEEIGR